MTEDTATAIVAVVIGGGLGGILVLAALRKGLDYDGRIHRKVPGKRRYYGI